MRRVLWTAGLVLSAYLIGRAVVELFVIDYGDPASYRNDWGGPSLAGVLAVHSGPGLLAAALLAWAIVRARRAPRRQSPLPGRRPHRMAAGVDLQPPS